MFVGREYELQELNTLYQSPQANLVVVHGRRRVGKSTLIETFMADKPCLHFDGLEGLQTKGQIEQFTADLRQQMDDPLLKHVNFNEWTPIFEYLTEYFKQQTNKLVVFFDEFQWLAVNQTKLVSLIKSYWDRHWKNSNVMIVLCGSVSSFMVKRVINSKALYGRIDREISLQPFAPREILQLLDHKRSKDEIMRYAITLGGIPKYLQAIDSSQSFEQNMNKLFFMENSQFANEYDKIFYSQFREYKVYESIANYLQDRPRTLDEIAKHLKLPSGGGLRSYLVNLEKTAFITSFIPYDKDQNTKLIKYKLTDEYLRFYFKYILPNTQRIQQNRKANLFSQLVVPHWQSWLGFAFENFCLKNAFRLAELMGFADAVLSWGPYFRKQDTHFQLDLVYSRSDNVITVCEMKYRDKPIGVEVVAEVEKKCAELTIPRGYTLEKALISRFGADEPLQKLGYFHHLLSVDDLFE
tara:strand:+ start:1130 stop:2530 length:1401 start_codon:yes stop_codon:yes gene_type:complete